MSSGTKLKGWLLNNTSAGVKFVGSTVASLILAGFEELLEKNIPCPCEKYMNKIYTALFFCIPFFALLLITLMVQLQSGEWKGSLDCSESKQRCERFKDDPKSNEGCERCKDCCCTKFGPSMIVLMKLFLPSTMWIVILLLDGDYYACSEFMKNETVTGKTCGEFNCSQNPSKVPPALRDLCYVSRFSGGIISIVAVLAALCYFGCYCGCQMASDNIEDPKKSTSANREDNPNQSPDTGTEMQQLNTQAGKVEDARDKSEPKFECHLFAHW